MKTKFRCSVRCALVPNQHVQGTSWRYSLSDYLHDFLESDISADDALPVSDAEVCQTKSDQHRFDHQEQAAARNL